MGRTDRENPVIAELVKRKAVQLNVYVRGEVQPRKVSCVEGRGKRWQRVADTLDALVWERIEMYDGAGGLLGVIEPDEESELEPAQSTSDARMLAEHVTRLCVGAFRDILREARELVTVPLEASAAALRASTEAMMAVQRSYEVALRVQAANAAMPSNDDDGMQKMMQAAMLLMNARPPAPAPAAPPRPAPPRPVSVPAGSGQ